MSSTAPQAEKPDLILPDSEFDEVQVSDVPEPGDEEIDIDDIDGAVVIPWIDQHPK